MKNTLWLYKDSYQIEIREKEAHPPQVNLSLQGRRGDKKHSPHSRGEREQSVGEKHTVRRR